MPELTLTVEIGLTLSLLALTVVLFAFELVRVDVAAIVVLVALGMFALVPGVDPLLGETALFAGFSSNAVITVIAVMILGAGLDRTGLTNRLAQQILKRGGTTERRIQPLVSGTAAFLSSFTQNIGAAALFLPVVSRISARTGISGQRLLMPMGFCAILGGTATMIGSSPLILLNDLLLSANASLPEERQLEAFGLFAVTPIGLALVATGILYFVIAGRWVLPDGEADPGVRSSRVDDYFERVYGLKGELFEARITDASPLVGKRLGQVEEGEPGMPPILAFYAGDVIKLPPDRDEILWVNAQVGLMGDREEVRAWCEEKRWELLGEPDRFADVLNAQHGGVVEIVVPPDSSLIGQSIEDIKPRRSFGTNILQIYRTEQVIRRGFRQETLRAGDTLVVHASWRDLARLQRSRAQDLVIATDVRYEDPRVDKIGAALAAAAFALLLFVVTDSLAISLLSGAVAMVLAGVVSIDEAYEAVNWQTVFLLASLLPLGIALERTGTAAWLSQELLALVGDVPQWVLQVVVAGLATFLTLVMSNIGATVLLVPLAVQLALATGADPASFALIVAISTSNSFLIPTHQVNALLMGPGGYQVADFMRAGGLMTLLFLLVSLTMLNLVM